MRFLPYINMKGGATMLRDLQEKFCIEYARCGNATQAYIAAGYKVKGNAARANASRMLTNANIQKRIKELSEEMKKPKIMDAEERQEKLTGIVNECIDTKDFNTACKALDILNKMQGSYVNKVELGGADGGPLEFCWKSGDKG